MNLIKNTLANLKAHKLRVFVTMIWIIIGITSVILVTSIGAGLEAKMKESTDKVNKKKTTIRFEPSNYGMMDYSIFLQHSFIETHSIICHHHNKWNRKSKYNASNKTIKYANWKCIYCNYSKNN